MAWHICLDEVNWSSVIELGTDAGPKAQTGEANVYTVFFLNTGPILGKADLS